VGDEPLPYLIGGNPGKTLVSVDRSALGVLSVSPIVSPRYGIDRVQSQVLAQEVIVEEAAGYNALNNGVVRNLAACEIEDLRLCRRGVLDHPSAPAFLRATPFEVGNVPIEIVFICLKYPCRIGSFKVREEVLYGPRVSVYRFGTFSLE
jgi:hypothetical protein